MKFMMMHKHDSGTETGEAMREGLVEEMGAFVGGFAQQGKLLDGAGLGPSKNRTRITAKGGQITTKRGPYTGTEELPAAMLLIVTDTREQGEGWAERYAKILGDGEVELGKVTEPWDLGIMPEPENPQWQALLVEKASKATESGKRDPQQKAALSRLENEMLKAGVLLRTIKLAPSSGAKRLNFTNNKLKSVDGPFTESKEMVGGFCVMELGSIDECVEIAIPYTKILGGTIEIDIRPVDEFENFQKPPTA